MITFALRGDSLDARYSSSGKTPALLGLSGVEVNTNEAGINGSTSIDMADASALFRPVSYIGRNNTPDAIARSVLMRVKFNSLSVTQGLFYMGAINKVPTNYIGLFVNSTPEIGVLVYDNVGNSDSGVTSSSGLGTSAWHDIVVTWTGDNTASGMKIYVDGTAKLTDTMTRSLPTWDANKRLGVTDICLGVEDFAVSVLDAYIDEVVIWNEVIDPTSVLLTSGSGSLNGASRTAYVEVDAYDGLASTGGRGRGFGEFGQ